MFISLCRTAVDAFVDTKEDFNGNARLTPGIMVAVVIWILIVLFVGKFLWNQVLCRTLTICKPIKTIWYILGLIILLEIIKPSCCKL